MKKSYRFDLWKYNSGLEIPVSDNTLVDVITEINGRYNRCKAERFYWSPGRTIFGDERKVVKYWRYSNVRT